MERKLQAKEISGWYSQKELTAEEKSAQIRKVDLWYEKKHRLNYRTVPLEIPGKMMLALGKIATDRGMVFSDFIEGILDEYLHRNKLNWRKK